MMPITAMSKRSPKTWATEDTYDLVLIAEIQRQTDRAAGLIAAEFVSERLKHAIATLFLHAWPKRDEDLFSHRGPFADFSARIATAHAFGIIGSQTHHDLNLVRHVRNEFAHKLMPLDFASASIASRCSELKLPEEVKGPFRPPPYNRITEPRDRYLFVCSYVMSQLIAFKHLKRQEPGLCHLP
jgi:DNA-binding MltR family transcriptional regulator